MAESLALFEQMRQGRFAEGEATLRMKMDITSENPCMWDLIAYRIKYVPHPMTGNKYCIYPSYDFTHCLNDSFEDIDLSLCTLEFLPRRQSYYWELDALEVYRPVVWEFSRLNITRTVMSKRKLLTLVTKKLVRGWDDPRLPTLNGLRRRGYSPQAINNFCDAVGVTVNTTIFIEYVRLEHSCRQDMEVRCNRAMGVLDPLLVELTNIEADRVLTIERPNHPADASRGQNSILLTRLLYVDRADFKEEDRKDFWGLAPGKAAGLRYASAVTVTDVVKDAEGRVVKLLATYDFDRTIKPKGYVHWVAQPAPGVEPLRAEVRLYEPLFNSERPDELTDWQADINPNSETIVQAVLDETLRAAKPGDAYQFERVGFFCCDPDTTPEKPVWVRTVSLKESKEKKHL
jgi:glutaminyl-tRNA synthetase